MDQSILPLKHEVLTSKHLVSNNNKINCLTLFRLLFGKQEREKTDFQTEVKTHPSTQRRTELGALVVLFIHPVHYIYL